jgi:hypothetical protein
MSTQTSRLLPLKGLMNRRFQQIPRPNSCRLVLFREGRLSTNEASIDALEHLPLMTSWPYLIQRS